MQMSRFVDPNLIQFWIRRGQEDFPKTRLVFYMASERFACSDVHTRVTRK